MLQLTRKGLVTSGTKDSGAAMRAEFDSMSSLKLPGFIGADLLDLVLSRLRLEDFQAQQHKQVQSELMIGWNPAVQILNLLLNQDPVRHVMQELTGCAPLPFFIGRIYRLLPDSGHHSTWHNDLVRGRRVGISINLSQRPYEGGCFELRYAKGEKLIRALPNLTLGDAILFRIDQSLEHRVTEVIGDTPKTAFAGWYHDTGSYSELFHPTVPPQNAPAT